MSQPQPKPLDPGEMSQEALVRLGEVLLKEGRHRHRPGSYEREAYEGSLGLLGTFPHPAVVEAHLGQAPQASG